MSTQNPEDAAAIPALSAYLADDHDRLAELLDDMLPGELATLAQNLDGLRQRVLDVRARKRREAADLANEEALREIHGRRGVTP